MMQSTAAITPPVVSILVPVFRNIDATRNCLESVLNSDLPGNVSVTVINDSSPEPELNAYCHGLAASAQLKLIVNEQNLGFVKSANRGIALEPEADILLLNSDTLVFDDWVQRLQSCAYRQSNIGTVTPFSNNGTICSYPVFPVSNVLPNSWTAAELDRVFKSVNQGKSSNIPTAVGFCMYIKRSCLDQTGGFDESNFGHGYGEECDFSLRASALGWKHVIAADVFVYHEGGASFASESEERKRRADKVMDKLHPHYHKLVSDFLQFDPLRIYRRNVDAVRLSAKPSLSPDILDEHLRYTQILLDRANEFYLAMLGEREQRLSLTKMLDECRIQFSNTDRALADAEKVVENLTAYLEDARIYSEHLKDHIRKMEQSRSWRYTKWLRRK